MSESFQWSNSTYVLPCVWYEEESTKFLSIDNRRKKSKTYREIQFLLLYNNLIVINGKKSIVKENITLEELECVAYLLFSIVYKKFNCSKQFV